MEQDVRRFLNVNKDDHFVGERTPSRRIHGSSDGRRGTTCAGIVFHAALYLKPLINPK